MFAQGFAQAFVEIFGNGYRAGDDQLVLRDQNRRLAGRVEDEEIAPPLEGLFLDQLGLDAIFGKLQPDKSRLGAEGMMIELDNSPEVGKRSGGTV